MPAPLTPRLAFAARRASEVTARREGANVEGRRRAADHGGNRSAGRGAGRKSDVLIAEREPQAGMPRRRADHGQAVRQRRPRPAPRFTHGVAEFDHRARGRQVASEKFPAQYKEKDGLITPWRVLPISILYNTELVKAADLPKTFDDLLNPKWSGKISIPDPTRHTTTAQFLWNLQKFKGDKWLDYVKALAKQKPILVESLAPVTTTVIKGEAVVGITYIKYIKQYKGPVDYIPMDKYLTDPNYLSLSAKSARPNAAKLYIDFACSPEGQKEIAEDGEFVLAPGVYPPIKDAEKVAPRMVFMDNPTEEEFKKLMSGTFREIFFAK